MSDPVIEHEEEGSKGRFVIRHDDGGESELTYSILSPHRVIADHTGVAEGHEGEGIGMALLHALLDHARDKDIKIIPLCPFVNAQRRRHPEWADLFDV